jgi:putative ABC transport system permease protein
MYPTLWKYTAGEVRRRPGRTLLTLLGIAIGVATWVSIWMATHATQHTYREMFETLSGRAALEVVAEGLGGFDESVSVELASVPGVRAALPVVQAPAAVVGRAGAVPAFVLGIDAERDGAARDYALQDGRMLGAAGGSEPGVLLEAGFAEANGFELGQPVPLWTPSGSVRLPVVGLLEPRGAASFNGGAVVFMARPLAQRLFNLPGRVNGVHLVLAEGADPRPVEAAVRARLPIGLTVQAPARRGELAQEAMLATEQGLGSLSVVSLVAGGVVILNAFLMNLGERRRQLAILRALGATAAQVTRLLLAEALALGLAGTLLGFPLGLVLAKILLGVTAQTMGVTPPDLPWAPAPFLCALVLGPGMALAATFLPARRAGRRSPLVDLAPGRAGGPEPVHRGPAYAGLACLVGLAGFVLGGGVQLFPPTVTPSLMAGWAALYVLACALVVPLVLVPLLRLAGVVLRPWLGREGDLALRQLDRRRSRTALTVGVLVVALAISLGYGNTLLVLVQDIHAWIERETYADYYVRSTVPDVTTMITGATLPDALGDDLAAVDGVAQVDRFRWVPARAGGQPVLVVALSFSLDRPLPLDVVKGDGRNVLAGLCRGEAALGTGLAQRLGLGVGDALRLETPHGPTSLRVAGSVREYTTGGMALYLDWDTARRLFDLDGAHTFIITARPGAGPALGDRLRALCRERGLICQSTADLRAWFKPKLEASSASCYALLGLVFLVAALGLVNTLTMNVLEQTRTLGVLRAIGLQRGQLRRLVLAQALALGLISLVPGLLLGFGLAYLANQSTEPLQGHRLPFRLDFGFSAGCLGAVLLIGVVTAYFPVRRAARLRIIEALRYE